MASNIQRGPRSLSAGDWVRLKRLGGAKYYATDVVTNADVTNPSPRLETHRGARHVYTDIGTSKTRRPASNWIDYKASQTADYVLESIGPNYEKVLTGKKVCTCATTDPVQHNGRCITCQYDKVVVR